MKNKVDFVIIWVDGNDEKWQKERAKYNIAKSSDNRNIRYRDWENLKYWFRGVEKYAKWVNKIHFVTYGHLPDWLNTENPKLNIVNHKDFIPGKYLPTFSSHTIELNLHRIQDLSDNFVYFNDDFFIINDTKTEDFFQNGIPRDSAVLYTNVPGGTIMDNIIVNNTAVINKHFKSRDVIKRNKLKWYNLKYGKYLYNNISLYPYKNFTGIRFEHLPNSFKKSTFIELWNKEQEILDDTCSHKFRNIADVNQWVMKYWQICKGEFIPRKTNWGYYYEYSRDNTNLKKIILNSKYKSICLNDVSEDYDFEEAKRLTIELFEKKFPEKSSFEK